MPGSDPYDGTSSDYEQFEKAQVAQDRDAAGVDTADVNDATAQRLVSDLVEPSGTAFDSTTQLAVFHRGWAATRDADAEGE
jgi:hypothetical protein